MGPYPHISQSRIPVTDLRIWRIVRPSHRVEWFMRGCFTGLSVGGSHDVNHHNLIKVTFIMAIQSPSDHVGFEVRNILKSILISAGPVGINIIHKFYNALLAEPSSPILQMIIGIALLGSLSWFFASFSPISHDFLTLDLVFCGKAAHHKQNFCISANGWDSAESSRSTFAYTSPTQPAMSHDNPLIEDKWEKYGPRYLPHTELYGLFTSTGLEMQSYSVEEEALLKMAAGADLGRIDEGK